MKKRIFALLLALCLCLALVGCAADHSDEKQTLTEEEELDLLMGSMEEEETPSPTPLEALYYDYSDYKNVLQNTVNEYEETMGGDYLTYGLCDLDGDGILELLVLEGTCEADYVWHVYTIGEMGAQHVGSFGGGHSILYLDNEDGVLCLYGQMGHERLDRITYDGQYLSIRKLQEQDLAEGEAYSVPGSPVALNLISDPSMIP